jgi:hypothetical protein
VSTLFSKATDLIAAGGASQEITTPGTEIGGRKLVLSSLAGNEPDHPRQQQLNNPFYRHSTLY